MLKINSDLVKKFGTNYPPNHVLFREGDYGDLMYFIHEGEVKISKKAKNAEQVLSIFGPGQFFGEMILFTKESRSATATTTKQSTILQINRNSLENLLNSDHDAGFFIIQTLCDRLYHTDLQIEELLRFSKEARVLKAILIYWKITGKSDSSGKHLLIKLDGFIEYVAQNLGIDAKDTKASLMHLREQGLISLRKDTYGRAFIIVSPKSFQFIEQV